VALENGEVLHIEKIVREKQKDCPTGQKLTQEVEHVNRALQSLENVDQRIFDKIDVQKRDITKEIKDNETKETNRFFTILLALLGASLSFIGMLVLFYFKLSAKL